MIETDATPPSTLLKIDVRRLLPIALSQMVGLACGVAGVKITSHFISPADYGLYGIFLSCAPLGMSVVYAGLLKFVSRHWAASRDRRGLLLEVLHAGTRKLPWLALASLVACVVLLPSRWLSAWPLLLGASLLLSCGSLAAVSLQAMRRHWADFAVSASGSLTRTVLPPLFYLAANHSLSALFAGYATHTLTLAALGTFFAFTTKHLSAPRSGSTSRQLEPVYEGTLFITLSIASWTLTAVNRWIVSGFFGLEVAGYFTLATNLVIIVFSIPGTILLQYAQPSLYALPSDSAASRKAILDRVDRLALIYTACGAFGILSLRAVLPLLIGPVIAATYRESLQFIVGACCFGIAITTAQFFHVMLLAGKRERACGPVDLSFTVLLVAGGIAAAKAGLNYFNYWLILTPIIPWVLTRPMARARLLK